MNQFDYKLASTNRHTLREREIIMARNLFEDAMGDRPVPPDAYRFVQEVLLRKLVSTSIVTTLALL